MKEQLDKTIEKWLKIKTKLEKEYQEAIKLDDLQLCPQTHRIQKNLHIVSEIFEDLITIRYINKDKT